MGSCVAARGGTTRRPRRLTTQNNSRLDGGGRRPLRLAAWQRCVSVESEGDERLLVRLLTCSVVLFCIRQSFPCPCQGLSFRFLLSVLQSWVRVLVGCRTENLDDLRTCPADMDMDVMMMTRCHFRFVPLLGLYSALRSCTPGCTRLNDRSRARRP